MVVLLVVFASLLTGSLVYLLMVMTAALRYLTVKPPKLEFAEAVSILKPLSGLDLGLESNLRTFFEQDFPDAVTLTRGGRIVGPSKGYIAD